MKNSDEEARERQGGYVVMGVRAAYVHVHAAGCSRASGDWVELCCML